MVARLRFDTPAREVIGTRRNHHPKGDLERRRKRFPVGIPVELETVSRLHLDVGWRHAIFPRFYDSLRIRVAPVPVLEEFLPYPAERPVFGRTGLIEAHGKRAPHAGARQEPEQRLEGVAVLVDASGAVPKVVGIIDVKSPADLASRTHVALSCGRPRAHEEVLVAAKLGSAPHSV